MRCEKRALDEWRKWPARITKYCLKAVAQCGGCLLREQAYRVEQIEGEGFDEVRLLNLQIWKVAYQQVVTLQCP